MYLFWSSDLKELRKSKFAWLELRFNSCLQYFSHVEPPPGKRAREKNGFDEKNVPNPGFASS